MGKFNNFTDFFINWFYGVDSFDNILYRTYK